VYYVPTLRPVAELERVKWVAKGPEILDTTADVASMAKDDANMVANTALCDVNVIANMAAGSAGIGRRVVVLAGGASMVAVFAIVVHTESVTAGIYANGVKHPDIGFVKARLVTLRCVVKVVKFA
jgi:hypothetical protein